MRYVPLKGNLAPILEISNTNLITNSKIFIYKHFIIPNSKKLKIINIKHKIITGQIINPTNILIIRLDIATLLK